MQVLTDMQVHDATREGFAVLAGVLVDAPDAEVPAYPGWTLRQLAVHVVRVLGNATLATHTGDLDRPRPQLDVAADDEPAALAAAVSEAMDTALRAIDRCAHERVWTPVGVRAPSFWRRRLLREAVLHRWDAEQAVGTPTVPDAGVARELIDEFLDTDVARHLGDGIRDIPGGVTIDADTRSWHVSLHGGAIVDGPGPGEPAAVVRGPAPALWLWLVRRDGLPGEVRVDERAGAGAAFTDLIDGFNRPTG